MLTDVSTLALELIDFGRRDYVECWEYQKRLAAERGAGLRPDTLILVEHPPVYTRGRSSRSPADGLPHPCHDVERGGDITFHGPGQLVGYPILDLRKLDLLVGTYLRRLEAALIEALGTLGVEAGRVPGRTGVWSRGRKLAAIGVAVRGWVSYHGFALNVCGDSEPFRAIRPCGLDPETVGSVSQALNRPVSLAEAREPVAAAMRRTFAK